MPIAGTTLTSLRPLVKIVPETYRRWPGSAAVFLPNGPPPVEFGLDPQEAVEEPRLT